jgi:hypothetical protein
MSHVYWWGDILAWLVHGLMQLARIAIPFVSADPENGPIPSWWAKWFTPQFWYENLDSYNRPNWNWAISWTNGTLWLIAEWAEETGNIAANVVKGALLATIGTLPFDIPTVSLWIIRIANQVGTSMVSFASSLVEAAQKLYYMFPYLISVAGQTWDYVFSLIKTEVYGTIQNAYAAVVTFATDAWAWVLNTGDAIHQIVIDNNSWWVSLRSNPLAFLVSILGQPWDWLIDLRNNFYSHVISILGQPWHDLITFWQGPLWFWFNIWSQNAGAIANLCADPGGAIKSWLENELNRIW